MVVDVAVCVVATWYDVAARHVTQLDMNCPRQDVAMWHMFETNFKKMNELSFLSSSSKTITYLATASSCTLIGTYTFVPLHASNLCPLLT